MIPMVILRYYRDSPSDLVLDNEGSEVTLNWQDNSSSEVGFRIYYRINDGEASILDTVGPNTTSYTTKLSPGNSYSFRVQAYNSMTASGYSNAVNATIPGETVEPELEEELDSSSGTGQTVLRFTIDSAEYYVQRPSDTSSRLQTMDTAPIISGGRTLLPIRYVSEPLGAEVDWDGVLNWVTVELGGHNIILWINNNTATVNGKSVPIDPANPAVTPIIVPSGRAMLPLRFIAEALGCQVDWNAELRQVTVTYPKP